MGQADGLANEGAEGGDVAAVGAFKNALRSGDIWVRGSRQFKDFNEYLLPAKQFSVLKESGSLALPIEIDGERYLHDRLALLEQRLDAVNALAAADELPDAVISTSGLKVTPLTNSVPADVDELARQTYALLAIAQIVPFGRLGEPGEVGELIFPGLGQVGVHHRTGGVLHRRLAVAGRLRAGFRWRAGGRFAAEAARAVQPRVIHSLSCAVDASAAGST